MCGRFTRNYTWAQIHAMYSLTSPASNLQPRFNICPTDTVDAVVDHQLVPMRWGSCAVLVEQVTEGDEGGDLQRAR